MRSAAQTPLRRLAAVLTTAAALAACSGSDDAGPVTTIEPAPSESTTTIAVAATTTAAAPASTTTSSTTVTPTTAAPTTTAPTTAAEPATDAAAGQSPIAALINSALPVNLAHAGGDQAAPHSTMFAFRESLVSGADALEMDVQLTGDGVLIVQHDDTVDKTTEASGPVAALTLEEIQSLDNAYWFAPGFWPQRDRPAEEYLYRGVRTGDTDPPAGYSPDDFRVETFRDVATAFPDVVLNVEIKGTFPDAVPAAERLAAEIDELKLTDRIIVVSFDDQLLDVFHGLAPDVVLSPGLTRLTEWFLNGAEIEPHFAVFQVPPFQGDIEVVNPTTVQRVHDEGRVIWVWPDDAATQENAAFYATLLDYGVDGIITGRPAEMVSALGD